ncbi:MAG: prepilin peptidase [Verrucomicrobiales bacterium]|jgi:leader peptidase (prepilin peptidase)/N-methyltransferase|nr:prepilin peptidase [Verrucomicrobiales bacterium]
MIELRDIIVHGLPPFFIGACVGSFLNVCIYRIPLGKSVVTPGSRCAACGAGIRWWNNLPILSWFLLRGRAVCCGTRIDFRYALVEALTAGLFLALWRCYGVTAPWLAVIYMVFVAALVVATFIDFDYYIIPDRITLGCCVAGLSLSAAAPELHGAVSWSAGLLRSAAGLITGGGLLWAVAVVGRRVFRKEAMGFGDVKFLAGMGALLGWQAVVFIVAVSSLAGAACGIMVMMVSGWRRELRIPYAPYLALAAVVWVLGGWRVMAWYSEFLIGNR